MRGIWFLPDSPRRLLISPAPSACASSLPAPSRPSHPLPQNKKFVPAPLSPTPSYSCLSSIVVQWVSADGDPQEVRYSGTTIHPSSLQDTVSAGTGCGPSEVGGAAKTASSEETAADAHTSYSSSCSVASIPTTYRPEDMCGFPADSVGWMDPGFM